MSCVPLTDRHQQTLRELVEGLEPTDHETLEELRDWDWVMPGSLDLTGAGRTHAADKPPIGRQLSWRAAVDSGPIVTAVRTASTLK